MEAGQATELIRLRWRADERWAAEALRDPVALLCDHAHCELRAASAAQGLIERNPERAALVERLARVAQEELRHFRQVQRHLARRGARWSAQGANPYVDGLSRGARATRRPGNDTRSEALLERLLVAACIEARSLERFELLSRRAEDSDLASFWAALVDAEREHARLYPALALEYFGEQRVRERALEIERVEAEVAGSLRPGPSVHSGPP